CSYETEYHYDSGQITARLPNKTRRGANIPESLTMRIAIGSMVQEANSFSPVAGSWAHFGPGQVLRGQAMIAERVGTDTELGGAIEADAQRPGAAAAELVPLLSAVTTASAGPLERGVFESLCSEMLSRLRE